MGVNGGNCNKIWRILSILKNFKISPNPRVARKREKRRDARAQFLKMDGNLVERDSKKIQKIQIQGEPISYENIDITF